MPIEKIRDMIAFATPLRIIERPERLIIRDYRPTTVQLLCFAGFAFFAAMFVLFVVNVGLPVDSFAFWALGGFALLFLVLSFRGTLREEYIFDKPTDTYAFIRRYPHRREVIEGSLSQFGGVQVRTYTHEDSESYGVVLLQDGMFLAGAYEQQLRDEFPVLNSYSSEARIANAISSFLNVRRDDPID